MGPLIVLSSSECLILRPFRLLNGQHNLLHKLSRRDIRSDLPRERIHVPHLPHQLALYAPGSVPNLLSRLPKQDCESASVIAISSIRDARIIRHYENDDEVVDDVQNCTRTHGVNLLRILGTKGRIPKAWRGGGV